MATNYLDMKRENFEKFDLTFIGIIRVCRVGIYRRVGTEKGPGNTTQDHVYKVQ